ncbi:helix-turn-helix domain-containing protein [Mucilaginibacter sp. McL0603]|uniref:helix-turn-helix domain-containing protein n=1 Tax=Mucilaginibacter sp. McL0603 TaxID=3415670 RepID=UPI003CFADA43
MNISLEHIEVEEDLLVIHKYMEVFQKYRDDGIIDLDKHLKNQLDFQIYRLEDAVPIVRGIVPSSRQTAYWITLVKKGSGEKSIGLFTFPIEDNSLFIIPKRVIHSSKYLPTDCAGYILTFNVDFFLDKAFPAEHVINRKVFKSSTRPYLHLNESQMRIFSKIFEWILKENASDEEEKKMIIALKILEMLIYSDRLFTKAELISKGIVYHPLIEQFHELVEINFKQEHSVKFYADALAVHPNHINFLLKKHCELNAKESINKRIILEAKYLLSNPRLTIKNIALDLGFSDANNFSTFFHKSAGVSAFAYRNSIIKSNQK